MSRANVMTLVQYLPFVNRALGSVPANMELQDLNAIVVKIIFTDSRNSVVLVHKKSKYPKAIVSTLTETTSVVLIFYRV